MPRLTDIEVDEIALVEKGSEPVNDDARIEFVKAIAAEAPDVDETLVQRVAKALRAVFKADAEGGDDGSGDNDDDVQVSDSGTHGAYDGTHTHDHQDGAGGMHGHEHSHDGDGDHGHAHNVSKSAQMTDSPVNLLAEVEHALAHLESAEYLEKADVGAAQMTLARGHVATMRKEAQAFIRLLQQTGTSPVSMGQDQGQEGDRTEVTPEEITKAITEALAAALPDALAAAVAPLKEQAAEVAKAQLQDSLPAAVKDAVDAAVTDSVKEAVSGEVKAQIEPIAKAVEDAQTEQARKTPATVPILNGAGLAHQAPATKQVAGMTYSSALRELLHD